MYPLRGETVQAADLRGGAALVIAGLAAEGVTKIQNSHHIFRGYEDICGDLQALGARVRYKDLIQRPYTKTVSRISPFPFPAAISAISGDWRSVGNPG